MTRVFVPSETTACALGADEVVAAIAGATAGAAAGAPNDITLVRTGSRGAFHLEPLLEVETDAGRIGFPCLDAASAAELFAGGRIPDATHARCIGPVEALPWFARQTRLTFARAGVIDPLDYDAWRAHGGGAGLTSALGRTPDAVIDALRVSGLRGRGGAAFPAHVKWRTVLDTPADTRYVVCNADEGDSGTFADRLLMECDPFQLLEGMAIAGVVLGAQQGYLYVRSEYPRAIATLRAALAIARARGLLGGRVFGSAHRFDVVLRIGAGAYVCGEETALLESLEGRRGTVRAKPPVPAVAGLFGRPTLVHNVLSLAAVTTVLAHGGEAYAAYGVERSRGTLPFQLGGAFARGGIVEVPFGLTVRELIARFCVEAGVDVAASTATGRPLAALQVGGPLGAYLPPARWDLPLDYEAFAAAGALIGHGGIVAFDAGTDFGGLAEFALRFCARESCGKCTPCRIGSVRGADLLHAMRGAPDDSAQAQRRQLLHELLETMELGSLCALGGLAPLPVRSLLDGFPGALATPPPDSPMPPRQQAE